MVSMSECLVLRGRWSRAAQARELQSTSGGKGFRPRGGGPWYQLKRRRVGS